MLEMWIAFICIWLSVSISTMMMVSTVKKAIKLMEGEY